jgi:hypothetical protein
VRHTDGNETIACAINEEADELADIVERSARFGTKLMPCGNQIGVVLESA